MMTFLRIVLTVLLGAGIWCSVNQAEKKENANSGKVSFAAIAWVLGALACIIALVIMWAHTLPGI